MSPAFYKVSPNPEYPSLSMELDDIVMNQLAVILFIAEDWEHEDATDIRDAANKIIVAVRDIKQKEV